MDIYSGEKFILWETKVMKLFNPVEMGGNKIIIFTKIPVVIVITAQAYNKPHAHQQSEKIVQDYLLQALSMSNVEK